jgi:hypothetical protein
MNPISELKRKVYITRKCRIEASERTLRKHNLYQSVQIYYSVLIVAYSIWNIQPIDMNGKISSASLFLMIVSIIFSMFSLYITTKNLQEKYFNLKINYLELDKFYGRLSETQADSNITELRAQYNNLLSAVDNHDSIDYFRVLLNDRDERRDLSPERLSELETHIKKSQRLETFYKWLLYLAPITIPLAFKMLMSGLNALFTV